MDRTPEKNANDEPSTIDDIEALRFCAFAPPGSPRINTFSCDVNNEVEFCILTPKNAGAGFSPNQEQRSLKRVLPAVAQHLP
jgi:hypothetical protein